MLCDKTKQCTVDILIPHKRAITIPTVDGGRHTFCLKFVLKVTHPLQKRRVRQISTYNVSTILEYASHGLSVIAELLVMYVLIDNWPSLICYACVVVVKVIAYKGERTLDAFVKFIESDGTVSYFRSVQGGPNRQSIVLVLTTRNKETKHYIHQKHKRETENLADSMQRTNLLQMKNGTVWYMKRFSVSTYMAVRNF